MLMTLYIASNPTIMGPIYEPIIPALEWLMTETNDVNWLRLSHYLAI